MSRRAIGRWPELWLALALAACAVPAGPPASTDQPPTSIPTASATPEPAARAPSLLPLVNVTPALVLEPPDFVPSPTPTLLSLPLPAEKLQIEAPGPGSQVVSPIHIVGIGGPSYRDQVHLRLIGEDGRVIAQVRTYLLVPSGRAGRFIVDLPFDLATVAEAALIEASVENPLTGRLDHVTTRRVVLLSTGRPLLQPNMTAPEKVTIFSPREDRVISGSSITVRGAAWLDEDLPLLIELLDRQGQVLASAEAPLLAPAPGELGTFEATLTYTLPYQQYAWVAVTERGSHPPAVLHYTSVRVYLRP